MSIIFGTDGWRGLLGSEVNAESISIAAQAFADYSLKNKANAVAVGFDGRRNSKEFAIIFSEVLSGNGIKVYLSESITPTPFLSFYVRKFNLSSGVMITASHNPPEYSGVKFKSGYGGPFLTEETAEIEKLLNVSPVIKSRSNINVADLFTPYLKRINELIDFEVIRRAGLNILIDSMGGAGNDYLERILAEHKIPAITIFAPPDNRFYERQAEPIEKNLLPLRDELIKGTYSLGLATDGDADRLGVMLDTGEWLSAQETIMLLAGFIVNEKKIPGKIVKTSSVTGKLQSVFGKEREIADVQVGFKYITEEMIKSPVAFGCEESGGFGYGMHIPERDGILSALFMIEMLAGSGYKRLKELVIKRREESGNIYYARIDMFYDHPDRNKRFGDIFAGGIKKINDFSIIETETFLSSRGIINGIKLIMNGSNRWLLFRSSETEPVIRIYAEGNSDEEVKELLSTGKEYFH
jgi:phosphomannomutase